MLNLNGQKSLYENFPRFLPSVCHISLCKVRTHDLLCRKKVIFKKTNHYFVSNCSSFLMELHVIKITCDDLVQVIIFIVFLIHA